LIKKCLNSLQYSYLKSKTTPEDILIDYIIFLIGYKIMSSS